MSNDARLEIRLPTELKRWVIENGGSELVRTLIEKERERTMPKVDGWKWSGHMFEDRPYAILEKEVEFDLFTYGNTPYWIMPLVIDSDFKLSPDYDQAKARHLETSLDFESWLEANC